MVDRRADVVAVQADRRVLRYGFSSCAREIVGSPRTRPWNGAEKGVWHTLKQWRAFRELIDSELIQIRVRDADAAIFDPT